MMQNNMLQLWGCGRRRGLLAVIAASLLLTVQSRVFAVEDESEHVFPALHDALSTNLVTPHIAWGKPSGGRKLKALVIGCRWGQRDTVELMQRCDIECVPVLVASPDVLGLTGTGGWGWEKPAAIHREAVVKDFREKLDANYDVIIMGQAAAMDFPTDIVDRIIMKVRQGTGLVYFRPEKKARKLLDEIRGTEKAPALTDGLMDGAVGKIELDNPAEKQKALLRYVITGIPFEQLPEFGVRKGKPTVDALLEGYEFGKGRALLVNYGCGLYGVGGPGGIMTPADSNDLNYEYYMAFVIKAVQWAARQTPPVLFTQFPSVIEGASVAAICTVMNTGVPVSATLTLSVRARDPLRNQPPVPWAAPGLAQSAVLLTPVDGETSVISCAAQKPHSWLRRRGPLFRCGGSSSWQ